MKKKRYILLLMIAALIMPLTGCVKYNANMDIKKDKSMYFSIIYAVDTSYFGDQEILDSKGKKNLQEAGFTVTDYKDGKMSGFTIARSIKNIDFVSSDDAGTYSLSGVFEKNVSKSKIFKIKKGFFKNVYTADFNFDASDSGIDSKSYIESNANLRKSLEPDMSSELDMNEIESSLSKTLDLSFNVTLPYSAISSNANSKNDNNRSLSWNLSSSDTSKVKFEFSLYNMTNVYMAIGGGVALLVIVAFVIMNNKNRGLSGTSTKNSIPIIGGLTGTSNSSNVPSNIAVVPSEDSDNIKSSQMNFESANDITKKGSIDESSTIERNNLSFNNEADKSDLQTLFNPVDVTLSNSNTVNNIMPLTDENSSTMVGFENNLVNNIGTSIADDNKKMVTDKVEPVTLSLRPIDNNGNAIADFESSSNVMNNQDSVPLMQGVIDNTLKSDNESQEKSDDSTSTITTPNNFTLGPIENNDTKISSDMELDNPKVDTVTNNQTDVPVMQGVIDNTLKSDNESQEKSDDNTSMITTPNNFTLGPIENNDTKTSSDMELDNPKVDTVTNNQTDVPVMQGVIDNTLKSDNESQEKSDDSTSTITTPNNFTLGPIENNDTKTSSDMESDNPKVDTVTNNQTDVPVMQEVVDNTLKSDNESLDKNSESYLPSDGQNNTKNPIDLVVSPVASSDVKNNSGSVIQDTVNNVSISNVDENKTLQNIVTESRKDESPEIKQDFSREGVRNIPNMLIEKKILPLDSPVIIDNDINS